MEWGGTWPAPSVSAFLLFALYFKSLPLSFWTALKCSADINWATYWGVVTGTQLFRRKCRLTHFLLGNRHPCEDKIEQFSTLKEEKRNSYIFLETENISTWYFQTSAIQGEARDRLCESFFFFFFNWVEFLCLGRRTNLYRAVLIKALIILTSCPLRIIKDKGEIPLWKPFSILAIMNAEIIAVLQKRSSRVAFERMLREEPT